MAAPWPRPGCISAIESAVARAALHALSRRAGLALVAVAPSRSEDLAFASTRVRTFPAAHSTRQSSAMWWPAAPCSHNACIRHRKLCPIKARSSHNLGMPLKKWSPMDSASGSQCQRQVSPDRWRVQKHSIAFAACADCAEALLWMILF